MKTSKMLWAGLLVVALAAMAVPGFAADNTASATASATIQSAMAITKDADLAFGKIVVGDASVVRVSTAGVRSVVSGTAVLVPNSTVSAASFDLVGTEDATYSVVLPVSVTIAKGADEMTVSNFASTGSQLTGTAGEVLVGADLNIAENQAVGDYTGTFDVSVYYN